MKQLAIINPESATVNDVANYNKREASRAIVLDKNNQVALLYVASEAYYKLPGGGIEGAEDKVAALLRECLEEIGCEVTVINEIGSILEHRKMFALEQTSYCYLAKIKGEKSSPNFTQEELEKGFAVVWLPYEEALDTLSKCKATSIEGREYIVPRDSTFLKEGALYLQ